MEIVKLLGAALVVLAGTGLGGCPVRRIKERIKEQETLYFCLLRLKSEINHGGKPLPEAIKCATAGKCMGYGGRYHTIMNELAGRLKQGREAYETILRECIERGTEDDVITKEEREAFFETFLLLGGGDKEKQIQMLSYYIENVRSGINAEKQKRKEKSYLYRSLGILGGVFLAVLMY